MSVVSEIVSNLAAKAPKVVEDQTGLFSKLKTVAEGLNFSKMPMTQLNKTLLNKGVTSDEIVDVLGGLSGTVSKPQVLERIKQRGLQPEDVILGGPPPKSDAVGLTLNQMLYSPDTREAIGRPGDKLTQDMINALSPYWDDVGLRIYTVERGLVPIKMGKSTKYGQWVTPGAEPGSYRELFVTAPAKKLRNPTFEEYLNYRPGSTENLQPHELDDYKTLYDIDTKEGRFEYGLLKAVADKENIRSWIDGHPGYGDISNPIVRIRFNDRIAFSPESPNEKKILFVEEIQGPQGDQKYVFKNAGGSVGELRFDTKQEALEYAKNHKINPSSITKILEGEQQRMPPALQERIYDIGVKRIIAYAKNHGYDGVAWTPGDMQVERYNLSNYIDAVRIKKTEDGLLRVIALDGPYVRLNRKITKEELPEYIGKDLAARALSDLEKKAADDDTLNKLKAGLDNMTKEANWLYNNLVENSQNLSFSERAAASTRLNYLQNEIFEQERKIANYSPSVELSGLDLKIGGEGLKSLYDVRISSLFKKYGDSDVKYIGIRPEKDERLVELKDGLRVKALAGDLRVKFKDGKWRATISERGIPKVMLEAGDKDKLAEMLIREYGFENHIAPPLKPIKVPYIPITKDTPSKYPIYMAPPVALAVGLSDKDFGPEYFNGGQIATPMF